MDIPEVAFLATREVLTKIKGRAADGGASLPWLAAVAIAAGAGDHLDIGSLFGASALVVALAKKWLGIPGDVYCIDPWEPRPGIALREDIPSSQAAATMEEVIENAQTFNVPLKLIKAKSEPVPEDLIGHRFASVYIDGWHLDGQPLRDFRLYSPMCTKYVCFDNYEEGYPDVVQAVHDTLYKDAGWHVFFKNLLFIALRRREPARQAGASFEGV